MAIRQESVHQGTPADLISQLAALEAQDAEGDARRARVGGMSCLLFVGVVVCIFVGVNLPGLGGVLLFVGLAVLVAAIVTTARYFKLQAADLDGDRLRLAREFVSMLAEDLSEKAPVSVTLRHGDAAQFAPATNQRTVGGTRYADYQDVWLTLRGRLQDGAMLRMSVTRVVKRKSKSKRKYTKINDRIHEQIKLALRLPTERYPHLDRLQSVLPADRLGGQARMQLTGFRVNGPSVQAVVATFPWASNTLRSGKSEAHPENKLTSDKLVSLMAFLYAGVNRCRAET